MPTGRITLSGRVGSLLEVGAGFHPELTGRENVMLYGSILGMGRREVLARLDDIVDFAGVAPFVDVPVKRYSSGMYVRLAFAVAAHLTAEIILVDEVLSVGDAAFQSRCVQRMREMRNEGRTILCVSHSMPTIEGLCSRAAVLERGRLAFEGTPAAAIRQYVASLDRHAEGRPRALGERAPARGAELEPGGIEAAAGVAAHRFGIGGMRPAHQRNCPRSARAASTPRNRR